MSNPELDALTTSVVEAAKATAAVGDAWNTRMREFTQMLDQLVGLRSSVEIKQKFQLTAIEIAEEGVKLAELRKQVRQLSDQLLEKMVSGEIKEHETADGIKLTVSPTIQLKLPEENEGGEEGKEGI